MKKTICIGVLTTLCVWGCAPPVTPPTNQPQSQQTSIEPEQVEVPSGIKTRIKAALDHVHRRPLHSTNSFWTIIHGILGNGIDATFADLVDPETKKHVVAMDHIRNGGEVRGLEFEPTAHGVDVKMGQFSIGQGHQDQFAAEIIQQGLPSDAIFRIKDKEYTFRDFGRYSMARASVTKKQELSWTLVVVSQMFGTDVEWKNIYGEELTFEDMVRYELDASVVAAACGGTHRLFGLTWAYHLHLKNGGKTEGIWREVADKIAKYKKIARQYQRADGFFSTNYLSGPGNSDDIKLRIGTTGHIIEWLSLAMSDEELRQPWMQEAASALSVLILEHQFIDLDSGAIYHAAHGLHLYYSRVFGGDDGKGPHPIIPLPPKKKNVS